ncbi:MAG: hypothetical protein WCC21_19965 [Candidatus Acidiferrales bacterium]
MDSEAGPKPQQYSNRQAVDQRLARAKCKRDNPARIATSMPTTATLFRLLSEFILLLLGAMLILIALTRTVGMPAYPAALLILGGVLIYWGFRILLRSQQPGDRWPSRIQAGSLMLVGFLVLGIRLLPLRDTVLLVTLAGGVLVVRGITVAVLLVRAKP